MEPVSDLHSAGRAQRHSFSDLVSTIARDNLRPWMVSQPPSQGRGLVVGQHVDWMSLPEIDHQHTVLWGYQLDRAAGLRRSVARKASRGSGGAARQHRHEGRLDQAGLAWLGLRVELHEVSTVASVWIRRAAGLTT